VIRVSADLMSEPIGPRFAHSVSPTRRPPLARRKTTRGKAASLRYARSLDGLQHQLLPIKDWSFVASAPCTMASVAQRHPLGVMMQAHDARPASPLLTSRTLRIADAR
jgi:hypothetical protein